MTLETVQAIARSERINTVMQFELQTTDATPTVLFSIDTIAAESGLIEYEVVALSDDGLTALAIKKVFSYKNDGSALGISTETTVHLSSDYTTAGVAANVNGEAIEVKVTGESSTINWAGTYTQKKINVEVALP